MRWNANAVLLCALLTPAWTGAQEPTPPLPSPTPLVRYEPGNPLQLPIETCEIQSVRLPQPYTVKLPVKVKIVAWDPKTMTDKEPIFEGVLTQPMRLPQGIFRIEAEGQATPIYVAYDLPDDVWQHYHLFRQPGEVPIGSFVIPGIGRVPTGQYTVRGPGYEHAIECRYREKAVFDVPYFETLPPFLDLLDPNDPNDPNVPGFAW